MWTPERTVTDYLEVLPFFLLWKVKAVETLSTAGVDRAVGLSWAPFILGALGHTETQGQVT